jgi:hypothetical protein
VGRRHGRPTPRGGAEDGDRPEAPARGGRFGKMFPEEDRLGLGDPGPDAIVELARQLVESAEHSGGNPKIPAGYTYLGQFIDHDITFDPTSKLETIRDPNALTNFRTPRFDLDSLYGTGPVDQPFLYNWKLPPPGEKQLRGVKLLVGRSDDGVRAVDDLPRNQDDRALIGDPRNDENIIVSQLQLLFIHFHNRVVDRVLAEEENLDREGAFRKAQQLVRWHYQWIVVNDFLPKIVGKEMAESVLRPGDRGAAPTVHREFFKWQDTPFMPQEFSAAAYRFGHSMVRDNYVLRDMHHAVSVFGPDEGPKQDLRGLRKLPPELEIKWDLFFHENPELVANRSMRIDPFLADPLRHVPPTGRPLALMNLQRGVALKLPAGRDVAIRMGQEPLSDDQLLDPVFGIDDNVADALLAATPLWYYVLCEARTDAGLTGRRLGPVGGRIVAEVLVGLLEGDKNSYLASEEPWRPTLSDAPDHSFTMLDLLRFTQGEA